MTPETSIDLLAQACREGIRGPFLVDGFGRVIRTIKGNELIIATFPSKKYATENLKTKGFYQLKGGWYYRFNRMRKNATRYSNLFANRR
jgi:hypothetical protein